MQERRQAADRRNGDRRVAKVPYHGNDRRQPSKDRRQADRRSA